jgi:pimeloyl-ACP methyl ester carboxylesterase
MISKFPRPTIKQLIAEESTYSAKQVSQATDRVMSDPDLIEFLQGMTRSGTPWEDRRQGFDNDMDAIRSIEKEPLPLQQIRCPTLIAHGTADDDVPYSVAVQAHERIERSELYTMENACHLLWIDPGVDEMNRRQVAFLRDHGPL